MAASGIISWFTFYIFFCNEVNLVQTFYSYNTHKECEDSIKHKKYANVRSLVTTSAVFFTHPVQKFQLRKPLVLINIDCRLIAAKIVLNKYIIMIVNMIIYYLKFEGYSLLCSLFKTQNCLNCNS